MKKESLLSSMPKLILAVVLIVCIGAVMGLMGWALTQPTKVEMPKTEMLKTKECVEEGEKFYLKPGEPQEKKCCDNLKTGAVYSIIENECIPETIASVCIDCPNDVCGLGENKCNCPEDCDQDETADWQTYRNEEFGFELVFPDRWKDYKVTKRNDAANRMDFNLIGVNGNYEPVFAIGVYSKEDWDKKQLLEGPKPAYLDENDEYVFSYSTGHGDDNFPGFPEIKPNEVHHGPYSDVRNKIVPTFKFVEK